MPAKAPSARDLAEVSFGKGSARDRAEAAANKKRKKHGGTKKRGVSRPAR